MAAWGASHEDVEHNVHDETASSEKSTVDTSSTDTHTILGRNRSLRNAVKELQRTFHMYKDTMEELIVKPVMILEEQTHNDISAAKGQLKESEEILTQAVILLKDGVKTMKEAMTKHSRKIDELCNYGECSNDVSCDILPTDCQTLTEVQKFTKYHDEIGRFYHKKSKVLLVDIGLLDKQRSQGQKTRAQFFKEGLNVLKTTSIFLFQGLFTPFLKFSEIQKPVKCYICNDMIQENRFMLGISMSYHSNCFRCCTCNKCLDGKPFTLFEDDVYCIDDFYRNFPLKSVFCGQGSKLLQRRKSRAVKSIKSLKGDDSGVINDIRPKSRTVKRSANYRYSASANGKPLNPILSNSPIKTIFMVGNRMPSSSFVMSSDDRPGTTSSQRIIGNVDSNCSHLLPICFKLLTGMAIILKLLTRHKFKH
ncbi:AJUBA [Mytilus coruscus]|uniref:AJUBA n=1 Tax=Mytilus coruscus TaxID=42192 RepID=A0A6J8CPB8_MYTCO|nr:AJUBA [Mytilus coruscus]